jgi:hypothetical protein
MMYFASATRLVESIGDRANALSRVVELTRIDNPELTATLDTRRTINKGETETGPAHAAVIPTETRGWVASYLLSFLIASR